MDNEAFKEKKIQARPPIVAVLGHVDHGKTTLLDYIRKTHVALKEAGGITQSISVSGITTKDGKSITFIDTPGHAAFSAMRSRGAKSADIAILVVASDDSVKPQTKEALNFIREVGIPFIVAATKIDLPSGSVEKVVSDLEKEQVAFEGRGGDVPLISVSGKTGKGVDELLQTLILVSELNNVSGSASNPLEATVVETTKDKRGGVVIAVVRDGKIEVGDVIVSDTVEAKVRGLFDWSGNPVKEVLPGEPAQILGFSRLPEVGSPLWKKTEKVVEIKTKKDIPPAKPHSEGGFSVVVKAANAGALEAILENLKGEINVIFSEVGDVNESDVFMAKSSDAHIYAFEVKVPSNVKKLAEEEKVHIHTFNIIYELFEEVERELKSKVEEVAGKAKVVAIFPYEGKKVAGCKVLQGVVSRDLPARLVRDDKELGAVKIVSMRRGKVEIVTAKQGEECGILFSPQLDFEVGDDILSVTGYPKS